MKIATAHTGYANAHCSMTKKTRTSLFSAHHYQNIFIPILASREIVFVLTQSYELTVSEAIDRLEMT